jgi:hypothetical protein
MQMFYAHTRGPPLLLYPSSIDVLLWSWMVRSLYACVDRDGGAVHIGQYLISARVIRNPAMHAVDGR